VPAGHQIAGLIRIGAAALAGTQEVQAEIWVGVDDAVHLAAALGDQLTRRRCDRLDISSQRILGMGQADPGEAVDQDRAGQAEHGKDQPEQPAGPAMEEIEQPHRQNR
jgi:hypothetical protein